MRRININFDNKNITYSGRFIITGTSIESAWGGNLIRFKVKNTASIKFIVDIKSLADGANAVLAVNVDNGATVAYNLGETDEVVETERNVTVNLPDSGEHDIILKLTANMPSSQYAGSSYIKLKSMVIDDGGYIYKYPLGKIKIIGIGDSWMGNWFDWLRLMDNNKYNVYPIAFGGARAATMNDRYPYQKSGINKYPDIAADAVVICLGINDYVASVSTANYKTSMGLLIDKVRLDQPNAPIFLIQAPRNIGQSLEFDQYGTVLGELSVVKANTYYINSSAIWNSLTWLGDNYHLNNASLQIFANFIESVVEQKVFTYDDIKLRFRNETKSYTLYDESDLVDISFRINTNKGVKCVKLVNELDSSASQAKVQARNSIKTLMDDDLKIHIYKMNEFTGDTATDAVGGKNGTCGAGATIVDGLVFKARSFNGTSNAVINFSDCIIPKGEKSVKFTAKIASAPTYRGYIFDNTGASENAHGISIFVDSDGYINFASYGGTGTARFSIKSNITVCNNIWYNIMCTWNGTTKTNGAKIYIKALSGDDVGSYHNGTGWVEGFTHNVSGTAGFLELCDTSNNLKIGNTVGKNGFNKDDANNIANKFINDTGGLSNLAGFTATDFIPITQNTVYCFSPTAFWVQGYRVAWYDASKTFISHNVDLSATRTSPANAVYLRGHFATADLSVAQIEKGSIATTYQPWAGGGALALNGVIDNIEVINIARTAMDDY